jgi:bifunctional non-homologous end joining protein LigD
MDQRLSIGQIEVEVTHADRVLFPDDGITKGDLAAYYRDVADAMLPHVLGRPLHMQRFPRGVAEAGFVQKEVPENAPKWVERVTVEKEGGHVTHAVCDNAATLVWLANLSCITPHVWQSRIDSLDRPDRMVLDLDPAEDDFESVRRAAKLLRALLDELELPAFLMSTGSRGLHVVVPLQPERDFDSVRAISQQIADELVRRDPERMTVEMRKEDRRGRLFVDTLRNSYGATAVTPYAVRARAGAPVAAPLEWDELDDPNTNPRRFTLRNMDARLRESGDLWRGMEQKAVSLNEVSARLRHLRGGRAHAA